MTDRFSPGATYRLQFHTGFGFDDARGIVPYLKDLGVAHVYASPILKARAGSTHGYDITDHNALNPELGDQAAFDKFCKALKDHDLGLMMDFVPNHMGIGQADNEWWLDVLEWGVASPYARFFDIDWSPAKRELHHKVLLPFLGDQYGHVLESGQLILAFDEADGTFSVWYYEHRFPVDPATYPTILTPALKSLRNSGGADAVVSDVEQIIKGSRDLRRPANTEKTRTARREQAADLQAQLAAVAKRSKRVRTALDEALEAFNGQPGRRQSFRALHRLLEAQNYRLAFWRVASDEINYRRFFQINDLAGLRMEEEAVFEATHRLTLDLIRQGCVTGLRIDHIDGLFAPRTYLERLQDSARPLLLPRDDQPRDLWVLVEKILGAHESLRDAWAVGGTTGYEVMVALNGVLIDQSAEKTLTRFYERLLPGALPPFEEIVYTCKRLVMNQELAAELNVLANEMNRVTEEDWANRDYTLREVRIALREVVACFPVYRTYVNEDGATPDDLRDIDWAVARARKTRAVADPSIYDFVRAVLTTDYARTKEHRRHMPEIVRLGRKFQQYTGPVMAKGVEDTAFYRYNRLISLNEVGGHPSHFGLSVAAFHHMNQERAKHTPDGMLATATHDHKRGEDTRARITAISEHASEWTRRVKRWQTLNRRARREVEGAQVPHPNDEYLFYQALAGVWPIDAPAGDVPPAEQMNVLADRLVQYMLKALREAKLRTSWTNQDPDYEEAMEQYVRTVLDASRHNPFLVDMATFCAEIAPAGMLNGLSQTVLKLTAPGMPDTYQGTELWDDSLVDPDNRRPVDFDKRRRFLGDVTKAAAKDRTGLLTDLLDTWADGRIKIYVVHELLRLRWSDPELFARGSYIPLESEGRQSDSIIGFLREHEDRKLLVAVPRLTTRLPARDRARPLGDEAWGRTKLHLPNGTSPGSWTNVLTGERLDISNGSAFATNLLARFPTAVLRNAP